MYEQYQWYGKDNFAISFTLYQKPVTDIFHLNNHFHELLKINVIKLYLVSTLTN